MRNSLKIKSCSYFIRKENPGLQCPRWMPSSLELVEKVRLPPAPVDLVWGTLVKSSPSSFSDSSCLDSNIKSGPRLIPFLFLLNFKVFLREIHPNVIDYHFFKPLTRAIAARFLAGLAEPRGSGSEGVSQSCLRQCRLWAVAASALSLTEKQNGN